ncbi:MAG: class II aldolase/adducin family protein [Alphaproteobacteria bacterium]|nr:class II aldolase/adducin family protein [Alphaproteobacteria bacterium]
MNVAARSIEEAPALKDKVSAEEWDTRVELAMLYRIVAKFGMTDLALTHLTARVPGHEDHFLINPYGLMFEEVTASNLIKVDMDGTIVSPTEWEVNAAGFTIHSAIHMARPDVACVAHTHTTVGMALSTLKCGLLPITQHSMRFYNRVAYHDWEGISTNLDERERLVADLGDKYAMILRNHGLLVCGRSVMEAWKLLFYMEKSAEAQLVAMAAAHASGGRLVAPPPEMCEASAQQLWRNSNKPAGHNDWPALRVELDKEDPSYRH